MIMALLAAVKKETEEALMEKFAADAEKDEAPVETGP